MTTRVSLPWWLRKSSWEGDAGAYTLVLRTDDGPMARVVEEDVVMSPDTLQRRIDNLAVAVFQKRFPGELKRLLAKMHLGRAPWTSHDAAMVKEGRRFGLFLNGAWSNVAA